MSKIVKIIDEFAENIIASSQTTGSIIKNLQVIAKETKNLMDVVIKINERLNQHEQILMNIIEVQEEKEQIGNFEFRVPNKSTQKPN
jgi:hypothetical protein